MGLIVHLLFGGWLLLSPTAFANNALNGAVNLPGDLALGQVDLKPFYKGLYGKVGNSSLFIATKKAIPDHAQLYWAIVQVLSQKYGCMMRRKVNQFPYTSFLCRDQRIVVFHSRHQGDYVLFSGRQFDKEGREIIVKNRRIVARYPIYQGQFATKYSHR